MAGTASFGAETSARDRRRTPVVEAYERARDSVVNISATAKVEVPRWGANIFGDLFLVPSERSQRSVGSGFVLHEDGYIVTNAHVVSAGAQLGVTLADASEYEARVIGLDTARDLAVIKIDPRSPLTPIALGRSDDLMIGEQTVAVGNPVGLHNTVTAGVISALHRELDVDGRSAYRDVIQTDASINPGNSGGPLLNSLGELIGVNTAIRTDAQNIGFAIPVDQLREILPDILDGEKLNKVMIGMRVSAMDAPLVTQVREGSPADHAGVRVGDVVQSIDGKHLQRGIDFYVQMLGRRAGDEIDLTLSRDSGKARAGLKLIEPPKPDGRRLALQHLGLTVDDVRAEVARRFQLRRQGGVIVLGVEPKSPADHIGVRPGDLLVTLGRYWLNDVDQLGALLADVEPRDPIDVGFRREQRGSLVNLDGRLHAR
jgi:serine protease Do